MKRLSLSVLVGVVACLVATAAPAGAAPAERHCVVRVVEREADGELVTSAPRCYDSYSQARRAAAEPAASQERSTASAASSFVLAVHWDGPNQSGGSTSVVGTDCDGGWLNTSAYWATNMESTSNGCNQVVHHTAPNLGGAWQVTTPSTPGGNLNATLSHHVYSVQYTN